MRPPDRSTAPLRELASFAALALGATAVLHFAMPLLGIAFSLAPDSPALYLYLAGLAAPAAAALLLCGRGRRLAFLRSRLAPGGTAGSLVLAALAQPAIVALAWLLLLAHGGEARPDLALAPGFALLALGQLWVVLGEEPGWRGFALPRLERLLPARGATLVLALAWGVWHAPMFFVPGSLQADASPVLFASSILAWSALHTALHHRARPSIAPNLLLHACANITLNLGVTPAGLAPYLALAYGLVAALVFALLRDPEPAARAN